MRSFQDVSPLADAESDDVHFVRNHRYKVVCDDGHSVVVNAELLEALGA